MWLGRARVCMLCGDDVPESRYIRHSMFCSEECRQDWKKWERSRAAKPCEICGSVDPERRPDAKYCGPSCADKADRERRAQRTQPCSECSKPIGQGCNGKCRSCYRKYLYWSNPNYRAKSSAWKTRARRAMPPGTDRKALDRMYARRPEGYEVDHIIPLEAWGDTVCGLHVPGNLRYLTTAQNRARANEPVPGDIAAWLELELAREVQIIPDTTPRTYVRTAPRPADKGCSIPGCTAKHYGNSLCRPHYRQARRKSGVDHNKA